MKIKSDLKYFLAMLAIIPMFISCSDDDDPSIGGATIVFDDSDISIIGETLSKPITGSISAPSGSDIETITVYAVSEVNGQTNNTRIAEKKDLTEVNKARYTFRFDEATPGIRDNISTLKSIKIEAKVKNGDMSQKELTIKRTAMVATIVFDDAELTITNGKLPKAITGNIDAPIGTEIESIKVMAYYMNNEKQDSIEVKDGLTEVSGSNKGKYTFNFQETTPGIKENIKSLSSIKIRAQVKGGDSAEKSLTFKHENTALSEAANFEWKRVGGSDGTGLEKFGLAWTDNTSTVAIIKTDNKTKMVKLDADQWNKMETKDQLKEAVDKGTDIVEYKEVSSTQGKTYDHVLAVNVKGEGVYYLIHVTNGKVVSETSGTTITINGQYKD